MSTETKRPARVLIVGSNQRSVDIAEKIKRDPNCHFVGFADDKKYASGDILCVCNLEEIEKFAASSCIDEILVTLPVRTFYEKNLSLLKNGDNCAKVKICGHIFNIQREGERCLAENIKGYVKSIFNIKKKRVLIVGLNIRSLSLAENIRCNCRRHEFVGFVDDIDSHELDFMSVKCSLDGIEEYILNNPVNEVIISLPVKSFYDRIVSIVKMCQINKVPVKILDDFFNTEESIPGYIGNKKAPTINFLFFEECVKKIF